MWLKIRENDAFLAKKIYSRVLYYLAFFLLLGFVITEIADRYHVPRLLPLLFTGCLLGILGLSIPGDLQYFADISLVMIMLFTGMELRIERLRGDIKPMILIALLSAIVTVPGVIIVAVLWNFSLFQSILLAVAFITSAESIAAAFLKEEGLFGEDLALVLLGSAMISDISAIIIVSLTEDMFLGTPSYDIAIGLVLMIILPPIMFRVLPKLMKFFHHDSILVLIFALGLAAVFKELQMEAATGAFLAGLIVHHVVRKIYVGYLNDEEISELLSQHVKFPDEEKLHVIEKPLDALYLLFVPFFFIYAGAKFFIPDINEFLFVLALLPFLVAGKYIAARLGATLSGMRNDEAHVIGVGSIPRASFTIAIIFMLVEHDLLPESFLSIGILVSLLTSLLSIPLLTRAIKNWKKLHHSYKSIQQEN